MSDFIHVLVDLPLIVLVLLKITIVLGIGWMAHFFLVRHNPHWRVLLWRCIIVGVFLVPALLPLKYMQIHVAVSPVLPIALQSDSISEDNVKDSVTPISSTLSAQPAQTQQSVDRNYSHYSQPSLSLLTWLQDNIWLIVFVVWAIVATILTSRLLIGFIRIRKSIARSLPAPERFLRLLNRVAGDLHCPRKVGISFSPEFSTPFVAGFRKPVIVLPERMISDAYTDESQAILAHEVAHLYSGDLFWMFMAKWISALLWFHPLVWKLQDAHHGACEEVCDAVAVDYIGNAELYSSALARVALESMGKLLAIGAIPLVRSSDILTRLRMLKRKICPKPLAGRWITLSILGGMAIFVCLGSVKLVHAEENQPSLTAEKILSGFEGIEIEFNPEQAKGKMLLLCFWDMQQRPSRNLLIELADKKEELEKKGAVVLLVHTSKIGAEELRSWIDKNKIPFVSGRITNDARKVLYHWGVRAQPWLVLVNEKSEIRAGGFELEQLDEKLLGIGPADKQVDEISDKILLKLIDSEGLPVGGAKVGVYVRTRDEKVLNSNLSWSLQGHDRDISSNWGEITLSREKLFPLTGRKAERGGFTYYTKNEK